MRIVSKAFGGYLLTTFPIFSPVDLAVPELTGNKSLETSEEKEGSKKSLIELIFDPRMTMLASDALVLAKLAGSVGLMESSDYFGSLPRAKLWATIYLMYITKANLARNNYESLTKAKDHLISSGAALEVAITSEGYMFVHKNGSKDISLVTPEEFNRGKDIAVTNAELTYLRANNKDYAFNDKLSQTIMGATSLKEIREIIKEAIGLAGNGSKQSNEFFVNPHEYAKSKEGLEALKSMNITPEDIRTMDVGTLIKQKVEVTSNVERIEHAIRGIKEALTPQLIALLKIRAKEIGGKADENSLILEYANAALNHEKSVSLSVLNTFSAGNDEAKLKRVNALKMIDEAKLKLKDMPVSALFLVSYGILERYRFSDGSRGNLFVTGNSLPIVTKQGAALGTVPLSYIERSGFSGILDVDNVTIGGNLIDHLDLNKVLAFTQNTVNAPLPLDLEKLALNIIAPDLEATKKLDEAWRLLIARGITGKTKEEIDIINKTLESKGLPAIFVELGPDGNPIINPTHYARFAIINGYVDKGVLSDGQQFSLHLLEVDSKVAEKIIKEFKRYDKKFKPTGGEWFGGSGMYKGTIFIPIKDSGINAYAGSGVNLTTSLAELLTRADAYKLREQENPAASRYISPQINIGDY